MRNISLNVNCAAKRPQNLQRSEFIKARENSKWKRKLCVLDLFFECIFLLSGSERNSPIYRDFEILEERRTILLVRGSINCYLALIACGRWKKSVIAETYQNC